MYRVASLKGKDIYVLVHNQGALVSLSSVNTVNGALVSLCNGFIFQLKDAGYVVLSMWMPSQVRIETHDKLAKRALTKIPLILRPV